MKESLESVTKLDPHSKTSIGEQVRIYVVANHDIYVDGLVSVISSLDGHQVVACAAPGADCFGKFCENPADLLLIEQSVIKQHLESAPTDNLFKKYLQAFPELRIVIFARDNEEDFVCRMIRAGAHGFIDSNMTSESLHNALREVLRGGYWVGRKVLEQLIYLAVEKEHIVEQGMREKIRQLESDLTNRESNVLQCVLEGMPTRDIAETLCLSEQSVKLHLGRLFRKFDVTNRSQLILLVFEKISPVQDIRNLFRSAFTKHYLQTTQPFGST